MAKATKIIGEIDALEEPQEEKGTKKVKEVVDKPVFRKKPPCPSCTYHNTKPYRTVGNIQYRHCLACGKTFNQRALKVK